jgi:alpha-L-fucosidase
MACSKLTVKRIAVSIVCVLLLFTIFKPASAQKALTEEERLQWWQNAKFGMFLHWGLYSQAGGDWKGKPYKGNEHFMIYEKLSLKEYGTLADDFNPTLFDADKWAKDAKTAGMQYIIITSKHHEGFAMYNSPSSDYNIVKRTPFKRDPMKELAAACKKNGLKLGFYYSLGRDWQDPDVPTDWPTKGGRSNLVDYPNEDAKDFSKYFERKVKPQVRELLTQYGPIGVLWFDTPEGYITKAQSSELLQMIRDLQPACIVNSRIGHDLGDYKVSEQTISMQPVLTPWEACITMSRGWGYNKHDTAWKSPELIIRQLVEIVAKGGNLLLNIGPKGTGEFPAQAVDRLHTVGDWMKINSEAIYGTHPWDSACEQVSNATLSNAYVHDADADVTSKVILPDIYFTAKEKTVYVIARSWQKPVLDVQTIKANKYDVKRVSMLGSKEKIQWQQNDQGLTLNMPKKRVDEIPVYVFKVELK